MRTVNDESVNSLGVKWFEKPLCRSANLPRTINYSSPICNKWLFRDIRLFCSGTIIFLAWLQSAMDWEKGADLCVALGMLPFVVWMTLTSRSISAVGCLLFSLTGVLRLRSSRVRRWTDENQWRFLVIMLPVLLMTVLGAMPTK